MHSSRPLPLPWSAPSAFKDKRSPIALGAGKVCGPPRPVPRRETIAARSVLVRDENKIIPGQGKSRQRRTPAKAKAVNVSVENFVARRSRSPSAHAHLRVAVGKSLIRQQRLPHHAAVGELVETFVEAFECQI